MKLNNFTALDVFGYLNFDIDFDKDMNILIGINGSGKTSILRLIEAILSPSIRDLMLIPFSSICLVYEENNNINKINAYKKQSTLNIEHSIVKYKKLTIPIIEKEELEYLFSRENHSKSIFEDFQLKYSSDEVFKTISSLNTPAFLGLDRTYKNHGFQSDELYYESNLILSSFPERKKNIKRLITGSLSAGLMETQLLIQNKFKVLKESENKITKSLRKSLLLSFFKFIEINYSEQLFSDIIPTKQEGEIILKRRQEIEKALKDIDLFEDDISSHIDSFFKNLEKIFNRMSPEDNEQFSLEAIVNKAQIDRVTDLINIIDKNKSTLDKLFSPINKFLDTVNFFYKDTNKSLKIDTVGKLLIEKPNRDKASIEALSSGERQLIIIFAHLLFNENGSRSNVFIIDEPELSLHLKWQDNFISKIREVSPNTQLILATHSPEIVGDYDEFCIEI